MTRKPTTADTALARFAALLTQHLADGTRPGKPAGEPWTYAGLAAEVQSSRETNDFASPRSISNWCNGRVLPTEIEPILRALFGLGDQQSAARAKLRGAFMDARNEKSAAVIAQAPLDPAGDRWIVNGDVFAVDRTVHPTDLQAAANPLRLQLQVSIRGYTFDLIKCAKRLSNTQTWGNLEAAATAFHAIVCKDPSDVPAHLGEAYAQLLRLGRLLETDIRVQRDPLCVDHPLDPDVHGSLIDLVRTAAPWLRGFPTVAAWDDEAGKALIRTDLLFQPSQNFVRIARQKQAISEQDAAELELLSAVASEGDFQGQKAGRRAIGTAHNLFLAEAEAIAASRILHSSAGSAKPAITVQRAAETLIAAQSELEHLLKPLPADLREALRTVVEYSNEIDPNAVQTEVGADLPLNVEEQTHGMILKNRLPPKEWYPHIKRLNFRFNGLLSIEMISELIFLEILDISDTAIESISHISRNSNINNLVISNTRIKDIKSIKELRKLSTLNLSRTRVDDLSPLRNLAIEDLNISYLQLSDVEVLSTLTKLKNLDLTGSTLNDFSFLTNLTQLEKLNLSKTRFRDVNLILRASKLVNLNLSGTPIKEISSLKDLKNLEVLNLRNTFVSHVGDLCELKKLKTIDLRETYVREISYFKEGNTKVLYNSSKPDYGL